MLRWRVEWLSAINSTAREREPSVTRLLISQPSPKNVVAPWIELAVAEGVELLVVLVGQLMLQRGNLSRTGG